MITTRRALRVLLNRSFSGKINDETLIYILCGKDKKAKKICKEIMVMTELINPHSTMTGIGMLSRLELLDIRDQDIVSLYNDVCEGDLAAMLAVLYCTWCKEKSGLTEGGFSKKTLLAAIKAGSPESLDILSAVRMTRSVFVDFDIEQSVVFEKNDGPFVCIADFLSPSSGLHKLRFAS